MKSKNFIRVINNNRGIIKSLCKVYYRSQEDQQDVFQDIILQLWKSFHTYRGASEISTWIYRVTLNTILNKVRKERKAVVLEPIATDHLDLTSNAPDDNLELLTLLIRSLKDIDKSIVVLYLEGYRHKEIAEILNLTPTNVATRFNRVKSELKTKFNRMSHAS